MDGEGRGHIAFAGFHGAEARDEVCQPCRGS